MITPIVSILIAHVDQYSREYLLVCAAIRRQQAAHNDAVKNITHATLASICKQRSAMFIPHTTPTQIATNDNSRGILRLPDDILRCIFLQFAELFPAALDPPGFSRSWNYPQPCEWIIIAHICRRWRQIALTTPQLWAAIQLDGESDRVLTMTNWSGQVPLTIFENTSVCDGIMTSSKKIALGEIHRIKRLKLVLDHQTLSFLSHLDADAPLLKTLDLTYTDENADEPFGLDNSRPTFASWRLPALTHLAFHEREGRLTHETDTMPELGLIKPFLRPTITHLEIDALETPISVDTCLDLLRGLPLLQKLRFGNVLALPPSTISSQSPRRHPTDRMVHLPHLHHIDIQRTGLWKDWEHDYDDEAHFDSGVAAADLLRHFSLSVPPSVYFTVGYQDLAGDDLHFIFSVLRKMITQSSGDDLPAPQFSTCFVNLSQDGDDDFNFVIELDSTPLPLSPHQPYGQSRPDRGLTLHIVVRRKYSNEVDSLQTFFNFGFPLLSVATLRWYGQSDNVDDAYWPAVLQVMPALREIQVQGFTRSLVRAIEELSPSTGADTTNEEPNVGALPNLAKIQVNLADWSSREPDATRPEVRLQAWEREPLADQLIRTFASRSKSLEELIISGAINFSEADKERLESSGVVKTVNVVN